MSDGEGSNFADSFVSGMSGAGGAILAIFIIFIVAPCTFCGGMAVCGQVMEKTDNGAETYEYDG